MRMARETMAMVVLAAGLCGLGGAGSAAAQSDLLPDIIINPQNLYDNSIEFSGSQRQLRLSNGTANIGNGRLHLYGSTTYPDNTQDVVQRVYRSDGTYWERVAGKFIYHPTHNHIHFENWCNYNLRTVLPGDGVGPIVASGGKTSFCILDLQVFDTSIPGYTPGGNYRSCGTTTQGLTPGWMDIYSKNLDGQYIDITGIADGQYWLESVVDPANAVLEADETNNVARIKVTIGAGSTLPPDAYEPNDARTAVEARPVGQPNSPNLGPCNPQRVIQNLTIHAANNADWFRFYMPGTGATGDLVRIDFAHAAGDLDMKVYTSTGTQVAVSEGTGNSETISMSGRARGWYFAQVYGWNGATNPNYTLTINPSVNGAPTIAVLNPPAGDIVLEHGTDMYTSTWSAGDPDGDPTWVTMYVNENPALDGQQVRLEASVNTPGATAFNVINSAEILPGTYYVYAEITDGGTTTGAWSAGTVTFVPHHHCPADMNHDEFVDDADFAIFSASYDLFTVPPADPHCDLNGDTFVDDADFVAFAEAYDAFVCE